MSAILSSDDLNDFISPSVACIKPVEDLPKLSPPDTYEVTTDDRLHQEQRTAQISLTDCLACSGCVTSAEAVLVSLQSHAEVLSALDSAPPLLNGEENSDGGSDEMLEDGKIFVASVSPQVRASIAATYGVTEKGAGCMIEQLLSGPKGVAVGGRYSNRFLWVIDTNTVRDLAIAKSIEEVAPNIQGGDEPKCEEDDTNRSKQPILASACPGWICYAEKTHPYALPHLSKVKSPQAIAGTLLKSVLAKHYQIDPGQIWHLAIMPCFDKKLEASRQELTDTSWNTLGAPGASIRDVDCVITARELLMLADSREVKFGELPQEKLKHRRSFPDPVLDTFLFHSEPKFQSDTWLAGSSGGFLHHIILARLNQVPGSKIRIDRGRNADVIEFSILEGEKVIFKGARYYGFRNIQNLVRKLKPTRLAQRKPANHLEAESKRSQSSAKGSDYSYVEVMACPGGCTNGGGQIKIADLSDLQSTRLKGTTQKEWLGQVNRAYFSRVSDIEMNVSDLELESSGSDFEKASLYAQHITNHWADVSGVKASNLLLTTYRKVESDVGKTKQDIERVAALASKIGGGW